VPGMREELSRFYDRDRTERPFFKHGREFFQRAARGEPQAKLYTRIDGRERLLVDPMAIDPSGKTKIGDVVPNRDATRAAVGIYARGSEIQDFRIIDTTSGAQIGPTITGLRWFRWARDEAYAFLAPRTPESDAKQEPHRCYRHKLGAERATDELLIEMQDAKNFCDVYEPEDAPITVFETGDFWSNTIRIRPVASKAEPRTIYASDKFQAQPIFRKDRAYFRTNHDAPNWRLMAASYDKPELADWTTVIPEGKTVLDDVVVMNDAIVVRDREDVLSRLTVYGLDGRRGRELTPPVFGSVSHLAYDLDTDTLYAGLAAHTVPPSLYALADRSFDWKLVWQDASPLDTSSIVAKRVYVPAKDGARIPAFIVYRKDLKLDGTNPTVLYGYGGFNISVEPFYLGGFAPFINRGGVGVNLPTTLVVAGEYDSRVDPLHAKKFVAEVQNNSGQVAPFLLYMDFDSGHGTGKTQQQRVIDRDYELRFLMSALGFR
jgi:prolyl oligopeptidase